jgi:hypothetical protein
MNQHIPKFLQVSYNILVSVLSFFVFISKLVQVTLKFTQKEVMKMKMEDTIYQENLNLFKWGYTEIIWLLAGGDITEGNI